MASASAQDDAPDARTRTFVYPKRVVWNTPSRMSGGKAASSTENIERLLDRKHGQVCETYFGRSVGTRLVNNGDRPGVVLDFGRELHGGIQIGMSPASDRIGKKLRIRFGESVAEAMSSVGDAKNATNDHALRDFELEVPSFGSIEVGNTGFRFVRLDLVTEGVVGLEFVRAISLMRPMPRLGGFRSSDERLDRIFETAVRTVHLCCQEYLWDGIKRDRLVWVGDMYPEFLAGLSLYLETGYEARCIDFARETTPLPGWMNTMPTYSLWWIISLYEYVCRTGDFAAAEKNLDYLDELVKYYDGFVTETGEITTPGIFLDWQSVNTPDEKYGVRAVAAVAADKAAGLLTAFGKSDVYARKIKGKLSRYPGAPSVKKQAIALSALAGFDAPTGKLTDGGASGMSTFMSWAILNAAHDFVSPGQAMSMCRDYYGAMLDLGATSFFEDFDYDKMKNAAPLTRLAKDGEQDVHRDFGDHCYKGYRHSLCHGWSAGVIDYLFSRVLGIKIPALGGDEVVVSPFVAGGDVSGVLPVPGGRIFVEVRNGKVTVDSDGCVKVRVKR